MFFTCNPTPKKRAIAADHSHAKVVSNGVKSLVVDIHCHRQSMPATEKMKEVANWSGHEALGYGNDATRKVNQQQLAALIPKMTSVEERLADMDKMGVDIQAVCVPPYQYYYWAEPDVGREVSRQMNDELAEVVAGTPDRFVGLGTIPLQDTGMAVAELERCVKELGFRGVEISTNVNGEELCSPRLEKFFAKAEELDVLIFIHPSGFTHADRLTEHYFINLIGHPLESTIGISQLIFGGTMEKYPGLKICVAHGGGFLPAYSGRMDHGHAGRADCRTVISKAPTEYLKKFYFDTMVFEPDQLGYLINKFGADHILLGTDYPYDMGYYDPLGLIGGVAGLNEADQAQVRGLNAARLLKIG